MSDRPMKPIPISAAKEIAEKYGYDQIIIYARRVDTEDETGGEHMTSYGVDEAHCAAAQLIAHHLQKDKMNWTDPVPPSKTGNRELDRLLYNAVEAFKRLPPEEQDAMMKTQREGYVKAEMELTRLERMTTVIKP